MQIYTDLALEARELSSAANNEIKGVSSHTLENGNIKVHTIKIEDDDGERAMGKPQGTYVTLEIDRDYALSSEEFKDCACALRDVLNKMCHNMQRVLVVGLGNEGVTPDAVGPLTVKSLFVTRHIEKLNNSVFKSLRVSNLSAVAPGVMGQTGIESAEIISGVVKRVEPTCVIVIDALAARSLSRLATTVQVSDTGISPGSGIGNARAELSQRTLGVPVVSIGMPTVVAGATLTADVVDMMGGDDREAVYKKAVQALAPYENNVFVTPKEIDTIVASAAKLIAYGVNMAVHKLDYSAMLELT